VGKCFSCGNNGGFDIAFVAVRTATKAMSNPPLLPQEKHFPTGHD